GLPPETRLLYLVGLSAPEGKLTGLMTLKELAQRTGIREAQIPLYLALLPQALYIPGHEAVIFLERARRECLTWKVWVGALNKLEGQGHDPLLIAIWAQLHWGTFETFTEKGRAVIMGRLYPLREYTAKAQDIIRGAHEAREAHLRTRTTHNIPSASENRENTPIFEPHREGYIDPPGTGGEWPFEIKLKAKELWANSNLTARQIAERLGIPPERARIITDWAYFHGWPKRRWTKWNSGRKDRDYSALHERARELRGQGLSLLAIARELEVSLGAVIRWTKEAVK
ncbi:MAG: hypothetical protein QW231_06315, partial [Candidatus Bathyarchaeia archaeon]